MIIKSWCLACYALKTDGESGIQVKDVCDKVTIPQKEDGFVQSSSATGQGSNHIVGESTQFTRFRKADIFTGDNGSHINVQNKENQFHGRHGSGHHDEFIGRHEMAVSDFQGENQPMMEQGIYDVVSWPTSFFFFISLIFIFFFIFRISLNCL